MVDVCYSSEKRTSVERTGGIFRWKPRPATNSAMDDFPIVPPLIVKDMPRPRRLTTLKAARDYVAEAMRLHRPNPWRELWHRFKTVRTEEEAIEAIGDLRELLVDEDLLLPSEGPAR
jgi:hypothetical protein